jgi:preprotein translocase subunit SecG
MTLLPLLAVGILMRFVAVLFALVAIVLILVILIQKGRGGGLSGAFGGGMAGGLLGSKTGDFLTWVTIGLVTVFLSLAVLMVRYYRPTVSDRFGAESPISATQSASAATEQPAQPPATGPGATDPGAQQDGPGTAAGENGG